METEEPPHMIVSSSDESMPPEEQSTICVLGTPSSHFPLPSALVIPSSSSSTSSTSSIGSIPPYGTETPPSFIAYTHNGTPISVQATIVSRHDHSKERYDSCPITNRVIRLVTGCIPITNDGRILFISSKKQDEWVLPKGGWETDESIEKSALRETYEEAGVLGHLGEPLREVTYETRKGRKRRLAQEQMNVHLESSTSDDYDSSAISVASSENEASSSCSKRVHDLCRMTLFPLYITRLLDKWPESGRLRKVVSLDEAIWLVKREEVREVLLEIKRRRLNVGLMECGDKVE